MFVVSIEAVHEDSPKVAVHWLPKVADFTPGARIDRLGAVIFGAAPGAAMDRSFSNRIRGAGPMVHWYVMHSKPRKEAFLWEQLFIHGIEAYLPSIRLQPANPHSTKEQPFFPGYLFIHVDLEKISLSDLRWMPGARGIVCYGGEPAYVTDRLIQAIQEQVEVSSKQYDDLFEPGDVVLIKDGLFADYRAIFDCRLSGHDRVRVLLELLQGQRMRLELSAGQLQSLTR